MNPKGTKFMRISLTNNLLLTILFAAFAAINLWGCGDSVTQPPPPPPGPGPMLFVANDGSGTGYLSGIDLDSSNSVRQGVAGLGRVPNSIIRQGDKVFVLNSNSQDINILQLSDSNLVRSIDTVDVSFGGARSPAYAALAATGDIYISNFDDNSVAILKTSTLTISHIIPNVGNGPQGVLAHGDKVYVCISGYHNDELIDSSGSVAVISTVSKEVIYHIPVGVNPQFLIEDNSGIVHVVCTGTYGDDNGEIYKFSARADTITQVINIGGYPGDIAISGSFAYLANWGDANNGFLYRYEITTGRILNSPSSPILVSTGASRIVARADGSIFVSCWQADKVDEVVGTTRRRSWSAGDGPGPMFIFEH